MEAKWTILITSSLGACLFDSFVWHFTYRACNNMLGHAKACILRLDVYEFCIELVTLMTDCLGKVFVMEDGV